MTPTSTLVSCIVPVYNGDQYLGHAVESVLAQSWDSIELIIVDDGSTDDTADVARSFGPEARYVHQENAGPAVARNRGIAESTGTFIAFLDADDLWPSHKIARQMEALQAEPELDYCVGQVQNFWTAELDAERQQFAGHPKAAPLPGYVSGTLMARRSAFDQVGMFDPTIKHGDSADWFLRARSAGLGERFMPEVLLYRRMHEGNRSRQMAASSRDEFLHLLKSSLDRRRAG